MTREPVAAPIGREQFRLLYQRHAGSMVRHFEMVLSGNRAEAEDVIQECFCIAWEKRDTLRSPEAFRAWAMTIARNVMLGRIRRQRESATEALDPACGAPPPEEHVDARRSLERVEEALQALPEVQREAVLLVRVQGLKFSEAAEALGVSENTVKTRVRRGLLDLAAALDL